MSLYSPSPQDPICTAPPPILVQQNNDGHSPAGVALGLVSINKLWIGRKTLKVLFMNPDFIAENRWKCNGKTLKVSTIIDWANQWQAKGSPQIPKFENAGSDKEFDIKVKFSSE